MLRYSIIIYAYTYRMNNIKYDFSKSQYTQAQYHGRPQFAKKITQLQLKFVLNSRNGKPLNVRQQRDQYSTQSEMSYELIWQQVIRIFPKFES